MGGVVDSVARVGFESTPLRFAWGAIRVSHTVRRLCRVSVISKEMTRPPNPTMVTGQRVLV